MRTRGEHARGDKKPPSRSSLPFLFLIWLIFVSVDRKMNLVQKIDERTTIRNGLKLKEISTLLTETFCFLFERKTTRNKFRPLTERDSN